MLDICLLGCGGMIPLPGRWLTSLLVRYNGRMLLIDCGDGNQIPIRMAGWGFKNIDTILLTHYHADHISGLPAMLLTLGNSDRKEPITIMGPPGLKEIIDAVKILAPDIQFELNLIELSPDKLNEVKCGDFIVTSCPMNHTDICLAYSIEIKRLPRFDISKAKMNNVPQILWNSLQSGNTIEYEGKTYIPSMVEGEYRKGLKVCYTTDSRPTSNFISFANKSDLLICEGMYGDEDKICKALKNKHMLFKEAAEMAKLSNSKALWLTHFSPSMHEPQKFLSETKEIFKNTELGDNLKKIRLYYDTVIKRSK